MMEYILESFPKISSTTPINFTAIRTVRVLRPLRAINRVPSKIKTMP